METWTIHEAQHRLADIIHQAGSCGPQRVAGPDGDVFVVSADAYRCMAAGDFDVLEEGSESGGEPMSFVEFMQRSPLAEAMRTGEIDPDEWDRMCRIGR